MHLIFLDDERNFEDVTWVKYPKFDVVSVVRNSTEFGLLCEELLDLGIEFKVSFDHDIQEFDNRGKETTGYDNNSSPYWSNNAK